MTWGSKIVVSENAEQEIDSENPNLKRTTFYPGKRWLKTGGLFEKYKREDKGENIRVNLPGGLWIESKRTDSQYTIGKDLSTNFVLDVAIQNTSGNKNYPLLNESQNITESKSIEVEWIYSHKSGRTTYPAVFRTILKDSEFYFNFTAPEAGGYKLFLQITPVMGDIASSQINLSKDGLPYSATWRLKSGESLNYNFGGMMKSVNAKNTELLGNTLFLYSKDYALQVGEGFTLG